MIKRTATQKLKSSIDVIQFDTIKLAQGKDIITVFSKYKKLKDEVFWNFNN